jgi:WXG100 family type VII secretion target
MDYGKMNAMAAAYKKAAESLHESDQKIRKIPDALDQGGLIGDAGEMYKDAIATLVEKMQHIHEKLSELADDIQNASDKMEKGVSKAESRFS